MSCLNKPSLILNKPKDALDKGKFPSMSPEDGVQSGPSDNVQHESDKAFPMGTDGLRGHCVCKGSGPLLTCEADGCSIAVHEACLISEAKLYDAVNYHCPYCTYKRAVVTHQEANDRVLKSRIALSSFVGRGDQVHVSVGNNNQNSEENLPPFVADAHHRTHDSSVPGPSHEIDQMTPSRINRRPSPRITRCWHKWTQEEEEALKEALRLHPPVFEIISWGKILNHGRDAFHKNRTAEDLRYKWWRMKRRRCDVPVNTSPFL